MEEMKMSLNDMISTLDGATGRLIVMAMRNEEVREAMEMISKVRISLRKGRDEVESIDRVAKIKNRIRQPQPKGIYRIINNDGYQAFGRIESMTYSKLFIWNEVNEALYIIEFDDVRSMYPIKEYPKWIYNKSK